MSKRDGYVVDVPYPPHFHKEMQPVWLEHVVGSLGCATPNLSQHYHYCELGCGTGINLLVAAACNTMGQFVGVDFNARHIAMAREAAHTIGLDNVSFIEAGFDQLPQKSLPDFDIIATHGTWSWLPAKAQLGILQTVHQRLKPQGLFYLHYMCHPGVTRLTGIQKLFHEVSLGTDASSVDSTRQSLALLRQLADAGSGLFVDNPGLLQELEILEKESPYYLAHEFLTDHWQPQHSADVHRLVAQTGVTFIGSANCFENIDSLSIPAAVQPVLETLSTPALRETIKDLARNQHQRLDIFQRQPRSLDIRQRLEHLDPRHFRGLSSLPSIDGLRFDTPIGPLPVPPDLFQPLLEALAAGPVSFATLRSLAAFSGEPGLLLQALNMLMWAEHVHPMRNESNATPNASPLQAWLDQHGLPLTLAADCGTARQLNLSKP